jgi:hypothetical protein
MKINVSSVNDADVKKAMTVMQGNPWSFVDVTSSTQKGPIKPKLLTALLGGYTETLLSKMFYYDQETNTAQLPAGKRYDGYGKDMPKDTAKVKYFEVPSFGARANVAPMDWYNKRIPGTTEMMNEAYLVAEMTKKLDTAWMLHDELGYRDLLVSDVNRIDGGPFTQYNFYTDIMGGARGAKVSMELDSTSADHIALLREQKKELQTTLAKYGDSATAFVVICGDTFFEQRLDIERNESLGRPLKSSIDLASMEVDTSDWGSSTFRYDWFKGDQDGLIYINYGAEIVSGTKLISDTDAYMIPVGVSNFIGIAYAPAVVKPYLGQEALKRYSWMIDDDRQGVTLVTEENKLFFCKKPDLISPLVNS